MRQHMRFYADPAWVLFDLPMVSYSLCKPLVFRLLNIFNDSVNINLLEGINLINISNHLILHSCGVTYKKLVLRQIIILQATLSDN
jgi:hypothetical protein